MRACGLNIQGLSAPGTQALQMVPAPSAHPTALLDTCCRSRTVCRHKHEKHVCLLVLTGAQHKHSTICKPTCTSP